MSEAGVQTGKEKEELEKQTRLLKQIKEAEDLLKFTQEERKTVTNQKKKEIEKKEKVITQMEETNKTLQSELEILQVQVQEKLSKVEYKEKSKQFENERDEKLKPLLNRLEIKKNDIKDSLGKINKYKKEINDLKRIIEERVDLKELNDLNDQIEMSSLKNEALKDEINYLKKIQKEHKICIIQQKKIRNEIRKLEEELKNLKNDNLYKSKILRKENSSLLKSTIVGKDKEEIEKERKEQLINFWNDGNQNLLESVKGKNDEELQKSEYNRKKEELRELKDELNNEDENYQEILKRKKYKVKKEEFEKMEKIKKEKELKELKEKKLKEKYKDKYKKESEDELPKIKLFNSQEKKILLNVLPEKELEKYEKRFECLDNAKNILKRKYNFEVKEIKKKENDFTKRLEYSQLQIKQNEQTNKLLKSQNNDQKKEIIELKNKVLNCIQRLEEQKKNLEDKENENKEISKRLQEIQMKYEKAPPKIEDNEEEEGEEEYDENNNIDNEEDY